MKNTLRLLILLFISSQISSQTYLFPKGTYMNIDELKSKKPSRPFYNYVISKRTKGEITMTGGNDYKIESKSDSISKKTIKKEVFAISTGDTLYINAFNYKLQPWYCMTKNDGDYLYFKAGVCMDFKSSLATSGQAIGGIAGASQAQERYLYFLNLKTNLIDVLTEKSLKKIATQKDSTLLRQFQLEIKKDDQTLLKYYKLIKGL